MNRFPQADEATNADDEPAFQEGETVTLNGTADKFGEEYTAVAVENLDNGEQEETTLELPNPQATYEIISTDWDRGRTIYNLRLNGELDGHDYIRVWGVEEEDLETA